MAPVDRQRTLVTIRRAAARVQAHATESVASLVRGASDDQLERLMSGAARRLVLETIFRQMPRRLDRKQAGATRASIRWEITGRANRGPDRYQLEIQDGRCCVIRPGPGTPDPQVTITLDGAEFLRIATGGSDPTRAYFSGRVAVSGDVMVAAKLGTLFVRPGSGG